MKTNRIIHLALAVMIILALLPAPRAAVAQTTPPPGDSIARETPFVPGEVIVRFDPTLDPAALGIQAQALAGQVGATVAAQMDDFSLLRFSEDADLQTAIQQVIDSGQVLSAQPNYIYWIPESGGEPRGGSHANPDYTVQSAEGFTRSFTRAELSALRSIVKGKATPTFPREFVTTDYNTWGWDRVNAEIIWRNKNASPAVCVLDTGVDGKHKDLSGRVINGYDFIDDDTTANDDSGHGTHVAGVIAALMNNTTGSALGVSNGKIVAVKSLNAQGWGTSMSVAAGLRYCANRTDVRVINLSLGTTQKDQLQYDALRYAVVDKHKLIVTAAGNEYSSQAYFPAAWAYDGETAPSGAPNEIHIGILAVAAARINPAIEPVWVDTNGNDVRESGEMFDSADCAAPYSNYGRYVSLVAPGHYIYSTTPTSYPFWGQYYYADRSGYEFYSGTSQAAPFVAAAAARALSVFPQLNIGGAPFDSLKTWMIENGEPLNFAFDPNPGAVFDPANAWAHPDYNYGQIQDGVVRAPFCWPGASAPYTAEQDMSGASYLNVAKAMSRLGVYVDVHNASNGLPLDGATVRSLRYDSIKTTIADSVKIGKLSPAGILLNIPYDPDVDDEYYLQVSRSGYTSGYQTFGYYKPTVEDVGQIWLGVYTTVAVPPNKDITAVLNWLPYADANLDLYLWTPEDSAGVGIIGAGWLDQYLPDFTEALTGVKDWQQGTLLSPDKFGGTVSPYAQLRHDGGKFGFASTILAFDSVTIKAKSGSALNAWYTDPAVTDSYHVLVTDYSNAYPGAATAPFDYEKILYIDPIVAPPPRTFPAVYPVLRVWGRGKLLTIQGSDSGLMLDNRFGLDCANPTIDWWDAVEIKGGVVTAVNECGTSTPSGGSFGILPYP